MAERAYWLRKEFPAHAGMNRLLALRKLKDDENEFPARFGNNLPFYYSLDGGVAASPDGKHIYVSDDDALLLFERVGSR